MQRKVKEMNTIGNSKIYLFFNGHDFENISRNSFNVGVEGEKNSRFFIVKILNFNDVENAKLYLYSKNENSETSYFSDGILKENGEFEVLIPNEVLKNEGIVQFQFSLIYENKELRTDIGSFLIRKTLINSNSLQTEIQELNQKLDAKEEIIEKYKIEFEKIDEKYKTEFEKINENENLRIKNEIERQNAEIERQKIQDIANLNTKKIERIEYYLKSKSENPNFKWNLLYGTDSIKSDYNHGDSGYEKVIITNNDDGSITYENTESKVWNFFSITNINLKTARQWNYPEPLIVGNQLVFSIEMKSETPLKFGDIKVWTRNNDKYLNLNEIEETYGKWHRVWWTHEVLDPGDALNKITQPMIHIGTDVLSKFTVRKPMIHYGTTPQPWAPNPEDFLKE